MQPKELLTKLTVEQKASLLSGKNFWETRDIEIHGIPSIFLADGPNGLRRQAESADHLGLNPSLPATCFPTSATLANSFDQQLLHRVGQALGTEANAQNVQVLLGPGINMKRNPLCGRNFEYYSEDPFLAGQLSSSLISGIQTKGVSACVKHFAVNNQESNRMVIDTIVDERTLREIYLMPFEMAVKRGKTKSLMSSYNKVNGFFVNEHPHLLKDILRGEWGFNGVVVTDWGGSNDRVEGLKCGNELEMPGTGSETNLEVLHAFRSGVIDEKLIDENCERLLTLIAETHPLRQKEKLTPEVVALHHQLAREAAESAIVLLKNEGNLLPLRKTQSVAVIGDFAEQPRYQGAGSSIINPSRLDSPLQSLKDAGASITGFARGFHRFDTKPNKKLIKEACQLAAKADVALIYLGLNEIDETEGIDRRHMKLPAYQHQLVKSVSLVNPNVVVVIAAGSAIEMDFIGDAKAVVHGYLGGQAGATAMVNVIYGKVNPSGKLAETLPFRYEDTASSHYFPYHANFVEYREGLFIGYRYFEKANIDVRFPFGFGLSYTTFAYSNLKLDENGISVTITNKGEFDGAEVVQLYIGKDKSRVYRAKKELKGFAKVFIRKGESAQVHIPFDEYTFRYYDVSTQKFEIEQGKYQVYVGASSHDIRLIGETTLLGTIQPSPKNTTKLPSYCEGKVTDVSDEEFNALLGYASPKVDAPKKGRILVHSNTTIAQLKRAKGWTGRLLANGLGGYIGFLRLIGKPLLANNLVMGIYHVPMRSMSRMSGGMISFPQLEGLMMMFNGKFFKGLRQFFRAGKQHKLYMKSESERVERTKIAKTPS